MDDPKLPCVVFFHDDILLPSFLRRYLDKARRMTGYEHQVQYIEQVLETIEEQKPIHYQIPQPYENQDSF